MRTDNPTFIVLLIGVVILVGALTFFPALLLGPIVQASPAISSDMHIRQNALTAVLAMIVMTVLLGIAYPLAITGISQVAFPVTPTASRSR